jgi:hypothetical protein
MRADHHQESAGCVHAERDEARFAFGVGIFSRQREIVFKYSRGVCKSNAMNLQIGRGLPRISFVLHLGSV